MQMNKLMGSLTLPLVAPPLPDVVELIEKQANLVVVRSLTRHREAAQQAVDGDEGELCRELATGATLLRRRQWISGQLNLFARRSKGTLAKNVRHQRV